jgi:hypothetical protein
MRTFPCSLIRLVFAPDKNKFCMIKQTKLPFGKEPERKSFFLPVTQSDAVYVTLKPDCEKLGISLKTLEDFTTDLNYPSNRISSRIFELALKQADPETISLLVRLYTRYIKVHGSIVLHPVWKSNNGGLPFVKYVKEIWAKMDAAAEQDDIEKEYSYRMLLDLLLYLIVTDLSSGGTRRIIPRCSDEIYFYTIL